MNSLMKGARIAVKECMNIKPEEKVIIITDEKMPRELSDALSKAVKEVGPDCILKLMEPLKINGQEPPEEIAELMKKPDALFLFTSRSLSHTKARREASKSGVRIASMPKVTEFSFTEGGLTADYREVKELLEKIHNHLKNTKTIRITSENGTGFEASIEGREWDEDDGLIHTKGKFCNLPAGEISIAPLEGTAQGIIVIDKMANYGDNVKWIVKNGFVERIEGSESLEKDVNKIGLNARNIAEIGIGANPKARIIGNVLEDEKCLGTCHIAIGNNITFGGKNDVPIHVDGIILKPNLEVDGKILIKYGKWIFLDDFNVKELKKNELKTETKNFPEQKKSKTEFQVTQSKPSYSVSYNQKRKPYEPYIVREPLESHYFDPWVGGWTRLNSRFVINPQLYGYWIKIVEIHEKLHNIYQTGNEVFVEKMTRYNFRNGYFNLSRGYS